MCSFCAQGTVSWPCPTGSQTTPKAYCLFPLAPGIMMNGHRQPVVICPNVGHAAPRLAALDSTVSAILYLEHQSTPVLWYSSVDLDFLPALSTEPGPGHTLLCVGHHCPFSLAPFHTCSSYCHSLAYASLAQKEPRAHTTEAYCLARNQDRGLVCADPARDLWLHHFVVPHQRISGQEVAGQRAGWPALGRPSVCWGGQQSLMCTWKQKTETPSPHTRQALSRVDKAK